MLFRIAVLTILSISLTACNITGSGQKGPFKNGATVSTSQLDNQAQAIPSSTIETTVFNNQGNFSIDQIDWNGWTEIIVSGQYFDEHDNVDSVTSITLNAITNKNRRFDTANVNLFTHFAAARIKQQVVNGKNRITAWRDTQTEMIRTFGLNRVTRNINRGVEQLNLTQGTGRYRRDNANLLLFTGSFLKTAGDATALQTLTDDFADDAQFNGVGASTFNAIAIAGNTADLIGTLSQNLASNGANNPPNNNDLQALPIWVNTDDGEIDNTPPAIVILGDNPIDIEVGSAYQDAGATATDDTDTNVSVTTDNTVNSDNLGSYNVVYTATDNAGNSVSETREVNVVDTTAPSIVLIGNNPDTIIVDNGEVPAPYQDPGATVTDNYDAELSYDADTSAVDTATVGTYTVVYTASDSSGNEATPVEREVNVIPAPYQIIFTTNPIETSRNTDANLFSQGLSFLVSVIDGNGAVIEDDPTFDISSVDLSTVGEYPLVFSYTDPIGRTITNTLTVSVTNAPPLAQGQNITLDEDSSNNSITLVATDSDFNDNLVFSISNPPTNGVLGGIAPNVTYTPNSNYAGSDSFTFSVTDGAESSTATINITITDIPEPDTSAPEITILGDNPDTVTVVLGDINVDDNDGESGPIIIGPGPGSAYVDPGATALDDIDGDISANIIVTGSVNVNLIGTYFLTYNVTDAAGNNAEPAVRTVNVVAPEDNTAPEITLLGDAIVNVVEGSSYVDAGATAEDDRDGNITANIDTVNPVDTNSEAGTTFTITYNVADAAGNPAAEVTRTVIIDAAPPNSPLIVSGVVMLANGTVIDSAKISVFQSNILQSEEATSDVSGDYSLTLQKDTEYVLVIKKSGFANQIKKIEAIDTPEVIMDVVMLPTGTTYNFTPEQSFTGIGTSGSFVDLPMNAFQGLIEDTVTVSITPIDTTTQDGIDALPGSGNAQFELQPELSTPFILGAAEFNFTSTNGGEELNLAENQTATITIPLFHALNGDGTSINAGDIIPLLSLNETSGIWEQEGTATVIADTDSPTGFAATGIVSHFSWWSVALSGPFSEEAFVDIKFVESNLTAYAEIKARTNANYAFSSNLATISAGATKSVAFPGYIEFTTCFWAEVHFNGSVTQTPEQCIDNPNPNNSYSIRFYTPIAGTFHGDLSLWQDNVAVTGPLRTFNEAKAYCDNLVLAGRTNWELPHTGFYTTNAEWIVQAQYNTTEVDKYYWSKEIFDDNAARAVTGNIVFGSGATAFAPYTVNFTDKPETNLYGVRCVSNGLPN